MPSPFVVFRLIVSATSLAARHRVATRLCGSELTWAIAFIVPYAAVFLAFVVYPLGFALWMASIAHEHTARVDR